MSKQMETKRPAASPGKAATTVTVDLGRLRIPGTTIRGDVDSFAVGLSNTVSAHADLISIIYSGRYTATEPQIVPFRVDAAIVGRVVR